MAAEEEKAHTKLQRRGGAKSWQNELLSVGTFVTCDLTSNGERDVRKINRRKSSSGCRRLRVKGGGEGDFAHAALQPEKKKPGFIHLVKIC